MEQKAINSTADSMEMRTVDAHEFACLLPQQSHVFNSVSFTELNRSRCEEVRYVVFEKRGVRGGIILGRRGNVWYSPFSAPFGGLVTGGKTLHEEVAEMYGLLKDGLGPEEELAVTLPPVIYGPDVYAKSVETLTRLSDGRVLPLLNYHFDVDGTAETDVMARFNETARKKLRRTRKYGYAFEKLAVTPENIAAVYEVIRANRTHHGYHLAMTLDDVLATSQVVDFDLFILRIDGQPVASALLYHVAPGIVQVVYWGDMPGYEGENPMVRLAYEIFMYYVSEKRPLILDIGPCGDGQAPNYGLGYFKESIGCIPTVKWSFRIGGKNRK